MPSTDLSSRGGLKVDDTPITGELVLPDDSSVAATPDREIVSNSRQKAYLYYLILPLVFLTVTLLGGLRLNGADRSFLFLPPSLFCLIAASVLMVLFFRAGLIQIEGWFSEHFDLVKNVANSAVLVTMFAASTQLFNSLLPERGLPLWVVGFCFFWTLWNNLFSNFDTKRLLKSLGALFGLAFIVKYIVLANLAAPASDSWLRSILENPVRESATYILDLPRFSAGTGYLQFFAVAFYLIGLFLLPRSTQLSAQNK
jgi:hypothetical protein